MLKKHLTTTLSILALAMLCSGSALCAAEQGQAAAAQTVIAADSKPVRDPVAQLRGKLLYRRSQMRKLEKAVLDKDPVLGEKIKQLEAEIAALYSAAEPKLATLYAEEKELNGQIENLSKKD